MGAKYYKKSKPWLNEYNESFIDGAQRMMHTQSQKMSADNTFSCIHFCRYITDIFQYSRFPSLRLRSRTRASSSLPKN